MRTPALWAGLLLAASFTLLNPAIAGRPCEESPPDVEQTLKATQMAELTLDKLNSTPDKVVLIGRVGQDLSKYGLEYSHMAFAVRQSNGWNVVHELNACGTAKSSLFEQGMVDFFSDSLFKYKAGLWRLRPEVQERLLRALNGKTAKRMHEEKYNMLAYPFSTKYQNSNAWVLEILAFGLAPEDEVANRSDAQGWLKKAGYTPTQLEIGAMTRLGARVTRANIAFDDHPDELRWIGKIQTVTVASVIEFLGGTPNACQNSRCAESSIALALDMAVAPRALASNALALPHGSYVSVLLKESTHRPAFTYTVVCESTKPCQMTIDFSGDVLSRPLERSDRLVRQVQDTLQWVKAHSYPASQDAEYKPLEGLIATDCWDAGESRGAAGLCQFKDANGASTWVVLWADMCSATCYSGFVPWYVVRQPSQAKVVKTPNPPNLNKK